MAGIQEQLDLMCNRPGEPLFVPKGVDKRAFEVSHTFLTDNYKDFGVELSDRFGDSEKIPLPEPSYKPDLSFISKLSRRANFSVLIPLHNEYAAALIDVFMSIPQNNLQNFISIIGYVRDRVNPKLFNYALSVALLHRPDTKELQLGNFAETFPSEFLDQRVFQEARETAALVPENQRVTLPITIPRDFTASDLEPEHRCAYFREDLGVNLHHWHWHLVNPFSAGPKNIFIVNKDRRGELFYYMHSQLVARYNAERLCNKMARVVRFENFRDPIPEAYYPKLDNTTASRTWPARQANMPWRDLNREVDAIKLSIDDMQTWRSRIQEAIGRGRCRDAQGNNIPLNIDILGNLVEASDISKNINYYGTLHNSGHNMSAYCHDPDGRYLESFAVIADEATAMRDPWFYRWHAFLDDLFRKHKDSLPPYLRAELDNPGVRVTNLNIVQTGTSNARNVINTFWMQSIVDMSRGLDFAERGAVYTRFTHLNHQPYSYRINVNNSGSAKFSTCRLFIAPSKDERNLDWQFADQRRLYIEMDRFVVQLQNGDNVIERKSSDSVVTIPFERTFRDLSGSPRDFTNPQQATFNSCGCGWPQHMLVPRGNKSGVEFQLFVMFSNYRDDAVNQDITGIACADASSFCGIKDRLYPDKRAMGYPFDRVSNSASVIDEFLTPNMGIRKIKVVLNDVTVQNPRNPKQ